MDGAPPRPGTGHLEREGDARRTGPVRGIQEKIAGFTVLDPACGSGNFLYVALQLLLGLEKEVINNRRAMRLDILAKVSVQQLRAIELNAYAYELAQVSVQIGFLQWRRDNGSTMTARPFCKIWMALKIKTLCSMRHSARNRKT